MSVHIDTDSWSLWPHIEQYAKDRELSAEDAVKRLTNGRLVSFGKIPAETRDERALRLAEQGYANADDVKQLAAKVRQLQQQVDAIDIKGITEDDIRSLLAAGFHTAWRTATDSPESTVIWKLISQMDDDEWGAIIDFAAEPFIRRLRECS